MIRVLTTRPLCWDGKQGEKIIVRAVDIGNKLKNGKEMIYGVGTLMDEIGKSNLLKAFEEFKPDVFLFVVHFGLFDQQFLRQLKEDYPRTKFVHWNGNQVLNKYKVCWYIFENKRVIDAVLTNTEDKERKKLIGRWVEKVYTLYDFGFESDVFTAPEKAPEYDCFFGGGNSVKPYRKQGRFLYYSKKRFDLIMKVRESYNIDVRGGGWPFEVNRRLNGLEYFRAIQNAKIALGTYHVELEQYYTKRTVYSGATGRPYLVRYIPNMEKDFTNHKNILWYNTLDEAMDIIDHYLKHDQEREILGINQRHHFEKYHSWDARFDQLEEIVEEIVK